LIIATVPVTPPGPTVHPTCPAPGVLSSCDVCASCVRRAAASFGSSTPTHATAAVSTAGAARSVAPHTTPVCGTQQQRVGRRATTWSLLDRRLSSRPIRKILAGRFGWGKIERSAHSIYDSYGCETSTQHQQRQRGRVLRPSTTTTHPHSHLSSVICHGRNRTDRGGRGARPGEGRTNGGPSAGASDIKLCGAG
jgi:hypothetical protein